MAPDLNSLHSREKEVLRLLARGHDVKSVSSLLGISVHAANERLRDARRKLGVSSSRGAARLLDACEQNAIKNQFLVAEEMGLQVTESEALHAAATGGPATIRYSGAHIVLGGLVLLLLTALLVLGTAQDLNSPSWSPTPPKLLLGSLLRPSDYPAEALKRGEQGVVRYRVAVSAKGRVSACQIVQSSGSVSLDAATCKVLLEQGRFLPAKAAGGQPIAAPSSGSLMWVLQSNLVETMNRSSTHDG